MALQLFKIASTTVETPQTTVTFSNIPQGYTDLKLVISARNGSAVVDNNVGIQFNGSSATNYTARGLYGTGSTAGSFNRTPTNAIDIGYASGANATANTFGNIEVYIPNYTSSNYKSYSADGVAETNATAVEMGLFAGLWSLTNAITSITVLDYSNYNFVANSTFTLYGVL